MKIPGLEGDYCPTCAAVLTAVKADPRKIIVMCGSVCHQTLQTSGDYERLNAPAVPTPEPADVVSGDDDVESDSEVMENPEPEPEPAHTVRAPHHEPHHQPKKEHPKPKPVTKRHK